ncbi:hypothetical protein D9M71_500190 [compost metagenome]
MVNQDDLTEAQTSNLLSHNGASARNSNDSHTQLRQCLGHFRRERHGRSRDAVQHCMAFDSVEIQPYVVTDYRDQPHIGRALRIVVCACHQPAVRDHDSRAMDDLYSSVQRSHADLIALIIQL